VAVQPSGTVTFVFTDIEGSTALLGELGAEAFKEALADHRRAVREAFGAHSGYEVDDAGDGLFLAFASASEAVTAVAQAMASLAEGPVWVRVGVHTGEPVLDPPKYVGVDVHKAARIMSAAHGGQVLLSGATHELIADDVLDLGRHRLKDFAEPVSLYQLGSDRFPPLRTISNTNLPVPLSSFVGREQEVKQVLSLIREEAARLVTLAGPGGTGKTRLAVEAAGELVSEFGPGCSGSGSRRCATRRWSSTRSRRRSGRSRSWRGTSPTNSSCSCSTTWSRWSSRRSSWRRCCELVRTCACS
jgi:class 3 adenylate cyclase